MPRTRETWEQRRVCILLEAADGENDGSIIAGGSKNEGTGDTGTRL